MGTAQQALASYSSSAADFWAGGLNVYFDQDEYDASSNAGKVLGTAANLVTLGIVNAGGVNGTYLDSSGNIVAKTSGTAPRISYKTGGSRLAAMISEQAATNLHLQNTAMGDGVAYAQGGTGVTITAAAGTSPDGTNNAASYAWTGTSDDRVYFNAGFAVTNGSTYIYSVYVKAPSSTQTFRLGWFDANLVYSSDMTATTTWQRFTFVAAAGAATLYPYVANRSTGGGAGNTVLVWGAQLELAQGGWNTATSVILTTSAAVTRTVDRTQIAIANLPSYTNTQVTFLARASLYAPDTTFRALLSGDTGSADALMLYRYNSATTVAANDGTNAQPATTLATGFMTYPTRTTAAMKHNGATQLAVAANGTAIGTRASAAWTRTAFGLGANPRAGGNSLNGELYRFAYSPNLASDTQLVALSAGTL